MFHGLLCFIAPTAFSIRSHAPYNSLIIGEQCPVEGQPEECSHLLKSLPWPNNFPFWVYLIPLMAREALVCKGCWEVPCTCQVPHPSIRVSSLSRAWNRFYIRKHFSRQEYADFAPIPRSIVQDVFCHLAISQFFQNWRCCKLPQRSTHLSLQKLAFNFPSPTAHLSRSKASFQILEMLLQSGEPLLLPKLLCHWPSFHLYLAFRTWVSKSLKLVPSREYDGL